MRLAACELFAYCFISSLHGEKQAIHSRSGLFKPTKISLSDIACRQGVPNAVVRHLYVRFSVTVHLHVLANVLAFTYGRHLWHCMVPARMPTWNHLRPLQGIINLFIIMFRVFSP